jgi:hypothetical protein
VSLVVGRNEEFASARDTLPASAHSTAWFRSHRLADGRHYLRWAGLCEFLIRADGRNIKCLRHPDATDESFSMYLLSQVLSFSLLSLGVDPLHGTVIARRSGAIALVGDCGFGKSTLAAALLGRGCRVVTDDVVALRSNGSAWEVAPGLPRIKLFPSVARRLLIGSSRSGSRMNGGTRKLILPLQKAQLVQHPVPLRAVYVLCDPVQSTHLRAGHDVRVVELDGRQAFLEVVRAAFNLLVLDRSRLASHFAFVSRLISDVSVRRLIYPRRLAALPRVCDTLLAALT